MQTSHMHFKHCPITAPLFGLIQVDFLPPLDIQVQQPQILFTSVFSWRLNRKTTGAQVYSALKGRCIFFIAGFPFEEADREYIFKIVFHFVSI